MLPRQSFIFSIFFFSFFSLSLSDSDDFSTLLSFKASLVSDPNSTLSSWVWPNSTHPCFDSWFGVTCNPSTRRVIKLVLDNLNLTGSAQVLNQLTQLRLLSLKNNQLSSSKFNLSSWPHIRHIYLSHNEFSGTFPSGVSGLHRLRRLDLSNNLFSGVIPVTDLSQLPNLLTVRLEGNSFNGSLDAVDLFAPSVVDFNVSDNKLSGKIPAGMSRFPSSSFARNKNLCGPPLPSACSNQTVVPEPEPGPGRGRSKKTSHVVVLVIVIFDVMAIAAAVVTVTCCCYNRRRRSRQGRGGGVYRGMVDKRGTLYGHGGGEDEEMVVFEGCNKGLRNVGDLLRSSAELLGKGCVGTTYKVVMDGGDVVVVKRMRQRKKRKEVDEWLSVIGELRHLNIVSLRAYCNATDELLMVYDFLPNGSLHSLLHGDRGPGRTPLDWTTRLKIASDSAKGLAFLHCYNKVKLFHGHLSSSNIVIDRMGNACVSDIGVHQLLHAPPLINSAYKAPEVKPNNSISCSQRKYTQKCDVYSFGVVLLEILTGKMAIGDGESSIVTWVQRMGLLAAEENSWEVFDFELLRDKDMEEEMRSLLQVSLLCLAPLPKDRPKMSLVHRMVEDIRTKGSIDSGINSFMNNLSSDSSPSLSESTLNITSTSDQ